jgi:VWFA-related protein
MQALRFSPTSLFFLKVHLGALLVCVLWCGAAPAQDTSTPPQDQQGPVPPRLSITTHEVLLDLVVTGPSGQPVTGLKSSDLTVLEDGVPQVIASLQENRPTSAGMIARHQSTSLPPNSFTNYAPPIANTNAYIVILLDALNTRLDDQMSVRLDLIKYLKHMPPGIPTAIFERDTKMHLVQGFTSDPQVLLAAAESERNNPAILKLVRGTREEYLQYRYDTISSGFQLMGRYLAAFPGRKNLIWFTGELPQASQFNPMGDPFNDDLRILEGNPHELTAALTLSRVAVYPIDSRGLRAQPQYTAAANRPPASSANLSFDVRQGFQQTTLDSIAESSGGRAYYNSNDIPGKIADIVNNGSNYYTLTYSTTNKDWNGEFRHIKIQVNQPHAKLQYRQGYYAVDRTKQEEAELNKLQKKQTPANAIEPIGEELNSDEKAVQPARSEPEPPVTAEMDQKTAQASSSAAGATKAVPPKEGFKEAMLLGAIPSTEIIFTVHVSEGSDVEQIKNDDPWPQDNYLASDYKYKPFRTYTVEYAVDPAMISIIQGADGIRHASLEFVAIVYDQLAQNVNSLRTTTNVDLDESQYQDFLQHGTTGSQKIAVPASGNYFLRVGVHDLLNDRMGELEFAVDQVKKEPGTSVAQSR